MHERVVDALLVGLVVEIIFDLGYLLFLAVQADRALLFNSISLGHLTSTAVRTSASAVATLARLLGLVSRVRHLVCLTILARLRTRRTLLRLRASIGTFLIARLPSLKFGCVRYNRQDSAETIIIAADEAVKAASSQAHLHLQVLLALSALFNKHFGLAAALLLFFLELGALLAFLIVQIVESRVNIRIFPLRQYFLVVDEIYPGHLHIDRAKSHVQLLDVFDEGVLKYDRQRRLERRTRVICKVKFTLCLIYMILLIV